MKRQVGGMQKEPSGATSKLLRPMPSRPDEATLPARGVDGIADNRVTDGLEVYPYLMCSPGLKTHGQEVCGGPAFETFDVCDRRTTVLSHGHPLPVPWVATDRAVDPQPFAIQMSPRRRDVPPTHLTA